MKSLKVTFIFICILFLQAVDGYAQVTSGEALSEFIGAGIAYRDARYDEAISRYEKILDGNRVNGPLYYNLGNSYFKKGSLGKAILNYERAKKFIPRDSDLNFNDRYVRSQIGQYVQEEGTHFIGSAFKSFIGFYTIDEMIIIVVLIGILIGVIFLGSLYLNWPSSFARGMIIVLFVSLILYGSGLFGKIRYDKNMAVVMEGTESYFEPRADSTVHFNLPEGAKARILKRKGNWVKIKRLDGKIGWVDMDVLEEI